MGIKSFVKSAVVKGFNVKKWVDYEGLKQNTTAMVGLAQDISKPEKVSSRKETFEQAVKRLNLTEKDLQERMRTAYRTALGCVAAMLPMLAYATYLYFSSSFLSGVVATAMAVMLAAYAFRESFNYFQMQQRRLGCSVKEWFSNLLA